MKKDIILSDQDIRLRVRRIAYQIYESNLDEETVFVVGIANSGYRIATLIADELKKITSSHVELVCLKVNKKDLYAPFEMDTDLAAMTGRPVVLVDDVLNSGTVLIHAVRHLLSVPLKKLNTAVLVDRNHKLYPVKVDFKGLRSPPRCTNTSMWFLKKTGRSTPASTEATPSYGLLQIDKRSFSLLSCLGKVFSCPSPGISSFTEKAPL